jgi:hypothetical protein
MGIVLRPIRIVIFFLVCEGAGHNLQDREGGDNGYDGSEIGW